MNVFSAAERLASIDRSQVNFDPKKCLHTAGKFVECELCLNLCPVGAIQAGKPPSLDQEACENCLACQPGCPAGAFTADDEVSSLLLCLARLHVDQVELVCGQHPHPEKGLQDSVAALQIRGCLAALGRGAYFTIATLNLGQIIVRTDFCQACDWNKLGPQVEGQVVEANRLLVLHGSEILLIPVNSPDLSTTERPVWDAHNPPLSRRDFFSMASRQGSIAAARALGNQPCTSGKQPNRDRLRLKAASAHLAQKIKPQDGPLAGLGFGMVSLSENCSACGVCTRVCPTGALELDRTEEGNFILSFEPMDCIGCCLCERFCALHALELDHEPGFERVFISPKPDVLLDGQLICCERCGTYFRVTQDKRLCPICEQSRGKRNKSDLWSSVAVTETGSK